MKQRFQPQILIWKRDVTVNEESKERTIYGGGGGTLQFGFHPESIVYYLHA